MATAEKGRPTSRARRHAPRLAVAGFGLGVALGAAVWMLLVGGSDPHRRPVKAPSVAQSTPLTVVGLQAHLRADPDDGQAWARLGLAYVEQ
ncbi:MAG TPA: hypothetical protein VGL92_16625, partial [Acidimicrobiia bacterium]